MTKVYRDITSGFAPNPFTGEPSVAKGERAIIQSLKNLILTDEDERPFQPELGSNIKGLLFEPATPVVAELMKGRIKSIVDQYEPRVDLIDVDVVFEPDDNRFKVVIKFTVVSIPDEIETSIFLQRVS